MADAYKQKNIKNLKAHLAKDNNGDDIEWMPTFEFVKAVLALDNDKAQLQDLFKKMEGKLGKLSKSVDDDLASAIKYVKKNMNTSRNKLLDSIKDLGDECGKSFDAFNRGDKAAKTESNIFQSTANSTESNVSMTSSDKGEAADYDGEV